MKTILVILILSFIGSCANDKAISENTSESKNLEKLVGKWKAVSLFLSDASTGVCHQNKPEKDITFEFTNIKTDDQKGYQISGSGPVNRYFGNITFISFDETKNQGKILLKLINRETDQSSFNIVKAFLGSFRAGFWQTFGKFFGMNMKSGFHPDTNKEDAIIDRIAYLIEQGQL